MKRLVGLITLVAPIMAQADAPPSQMLKDDWLIKLKAVIPELICKGFTENTDISQRLQKAEINHKQCLDLIPKSADKCQAQYYSAIPATINQQSAAKWGRTLGECIGQDFSTRYLNTEANDSKTMTKDAWLNRLSTVLPSLMCKKFVENENTNKRLQQAQIDYNKCLNLIAPSIEGCKNKYYAQIPSVIDKAVSVNWGRSLGQCIGSEFSTQYLYPEEAATIGNIQQ